MPGAYVSKMQANDFALWDEMQNQRMPLGFELELTARCNINCRHCYINLPAADFTVQSKELSYLQIKRYIDQAASLGVMWCLLTGGEPLLRKDFCAIYRYLCKKGIFVQVFTNATLISQIHIELFKKNMPRDLEVTVYGATKETYEMVTRTPGAFAAFKRGIALLRTNKIPFRLKAVIMRSNLAEAEAIQNFCEKYTEDYYRFDPFLQLRLDGDRHRNEEIRSERLLPEEIVALEMRNAARKKALFNLSKTCVDLQAFPQGAREEKRGNIFFCTAGKGSFAISYDGFFRICSSLCTPQCDYELKKGSLREAYQKHYYKIISLRSDNPDFLQKCASCPILFLCQWCPGRAFSETNALDGFTQYYCEVAHARAARQGIKIVLKE